MYGKHSVGALATSVKENIYEIESSNNAAKKLGTKSTETQKKYDDNNDARTRKNTAHRATK